MRWLLGLLLIVSTSSIASLENDGVWEGGVWEPTVWADNVWLENVDLVAVPDVVGQSLTNADTALEGAGLDTGAVTMTCSGVAANTVLGQNPAAGAMAPAGSGVDLAASNGTACINRGSHIGIRIGIGL